MEHHTKQEEAAWREGKNTIRRRNYADRPPKSTYPAVKETNCLSRMSWSFVNDVTKR